MRTDGQCARHRQVPCFLQDELPEKKKALFEAHLETCEHCRTEITAVGRVIRQLEQVPREEMRRDLAPDILQRIPERAWRPRGFNWVIPARIAACAALALAGGLLLFHVRTLDRQARTGGTPPEARHVLRRSAAVDHALAWLAGAQEADGSWDAKRWDGHRDYTVGLTGLAVLAFLGSEERPLEGPHAAAVEKGLRYLVGRQDASGRFGPSVSGTMYNHGIATVAMLEAYGLGRAAHLEEPIDAAMAYIIDTQKPAGGWGYRKGDVFPANTSISIWQLHALLLARAVGWEEVEDEAARGMAWLRGVVDEKGTIGYQKPGDFPHGPEALTAMGASCLFVGARTGTVPDEGRVRAGLNTVASRQGETIDFYRWYFLTYSLRAVEEAPSTPWEIRLQDTLAERQVKTGPEAGSWKPTDQWGAAGGRVYSTALAVLSLATDRRVPRILGWIENLPR